MMFTERLLPTPDLYEHHIKCATDEITPAVSGNGLMSTLLCKDFKFQFKIQNKLFEPCKCEYILNCIVFVGEGQTPPTSQSLAKS